MISSLLHLVGLRPQVYYTLTNFRGGGCVARPPPLNTPMVPLYTLVFFSNTARATVIGQSKDRHNSYACSIMLCLLDSIDMGARRGRVKSRRSISPFKEILFCHYTWGLYATFSPCGGIFGYVFLFVRGPFSPCGGLFRYFFHVGGLFLSLYRGPYWVCPPPPRKFLRRPRVSGICKYMCVKLLCRDLYRPEIGR